MGLIVGSGFAEYTNFDLTYRHHSLDSTFYCTVMMLDILKHDKIWGTVFISVPHSKFWGLVPPVPVVIYVLDGTLPSQRTVPYVDLDKSFNFNTTVETTDHNAFYSHVNIIS